MKFLLLIISSLFVSSKQAFDGGGSLLEKIWQSDRRIISGANARRGQLPYMVSIQKNLEHHCGGAIISPLWVVSACHCFYESDDQEDIVVVAGLLNQGEHRQDIQTTFVAEFILHPDFYVNLRSLESENDIALLKLEVPLLITGTVKPVGLPFFNEEFTGNVIVSGWGFHKWELEPILPVPLQYLPSSLISLEDCETLFDLLEEPHLKLYDKMVCTVARVGRGGPCYHDSGSPLVQDNVLVGIVVSGDLRCGVGLNRAPSIYTKVSKFVDFIKSHVKEI